MQYLDCLGPGSTNKDPSRLKIENNCNGKGEYSTIHLKVHENSANYSTVRHVRMSHAVRVKHWPVFHV